jgi:hypothetical protein
LRADREIVLKALMPGTNNLEHVSTDLKNDLEVLKIAVSHHNQALHWVPEQHRSNKELLDIILSNELTGTYCFEHFPDEYRDNEAIAKKAVSDDAGCFRYISERLRKTKEIAIVAASGAWYALSEMPEAMLDDKDVVLSAVKNQDVGGHIEKISDRLKKDIDIVITSVSKDNRVLKYFPDEFKDNEKVIEACLKGNGSAYSYFSSRFKNNREIALNMSAKWDFKLADAPEAFRNDREIVKNAVKTDANNYSHIGPDLIHDLQFLKELYALNDGILYHMSEDLKARLFMSLIESVEHYGRTIRYEMVLDDGYVQNSQRPVKRAVISESSNLVLACDDFPVLTYEEDGPVGSYLSVRYLNNFHMVGKFLFFTKENTGKETWSNCLSKDSHWQGYGPEPQTNDDFLKHQVFLIPEGVNPIDYPSMSDCPRIYFGRHPQLPNGIRLFPTEESYKEALTVLKQEKVYGNPKFRRINVNTLEAVPGPVDEVFGAARVYVDGFGWRFLIPHPEGALKSLEVLKSTTDNEDLIWIKAQSGILNDHQKILLKQHFGESF